MSFKALFKPVKATLSLTAVTAINTAMIGALSFKGTSPWEPSLPAESDERSV